MLEKLEPGSFTQIPNKIFRIGLNPSEISVFIALLSFSGEDSAGIFPSLPTLAEMTGQSRRSVINSLETLSACNIVQWDRGNVGRSNTYDVLGTGAWIPKKDSAPRDGYAKKKGTSARGALLGLVDKPAKSVDNRGGSKLEPVHVVHGGSARGARGVVHVVHPNHTHMNHTQRTSAERHADVVDKWGPGSGRGAFSSLREILASTLTSPPADAISAEPITQTERIDP